MDYASIVGKTITMQGRRLIRWIIDQKHTKIFIILSFLCLKLAAVLDYISRNGIRAGFFYVLVFAAYGCLAFLSFRPTRIGRIATYVMIISMFLVALGGFAGGVVVPAERIALRVVCIVLGIYFVGSGIVLIFHERSFGKLCTQSKT